MFFCSTRELNPHLFSVTELTMQRGGNSAYGSRPNESYGGGNAEYGGGNKEYGGRAGGERSDRNGGGDSSSRRSGGAVDRRDYDYGGGSGGRNGGSGTAKSSGAASESIFRVMNFCIDILY